ncbi:MAG: hypothetical protein ACI4JK_03385 [Oscillospiraceae bacterium]
MQTLDDVKNYLNITWSEEADDKKVRSAALRAQSAVGGLIGKPKAVFFTEKAEEESNSDIVGEEEQLFLDCCRYIYNDAYEDFRPNFSEVIRSLRAANVVSGEEAAADDGEADLIQ